MSSEIEMAILIGRAQLNPTHPDNKEVIPALNSLPGHPLTQKHTAINDMHLNKTLRALTKHHGDHSLIKYIEDEFKSGKFTKDLLYFIVGINYLYPSSSTDDLVRNYWSKTLGLSFKDVNQIRVWAMNKFVELYIL